MPSVIEQATAMGTQGSLRYGPLVETAPLSYPTWGQGKGW